MSASLTRSPADRYALGQEIARGGMGIILRATDAALDREVALKVLQDRFGPDSPTARRFADEARITARLPHPAIPPVYDLGTLPDGRAFLAMKLIQGETLDDLLKRRGSVDADRGRFVAVFEAVCQAVAFAHSQGVIHRDLKPSNVMVGAFGEVQVMDWGLAKVLGKRPRVSGSSFPHPADPEHTADHAPAEPDRTTDHHEADDSTADRTQSGQALGTPAYMPPEQARGELESIDRRSDVFALGGILCTILTGSPPYSGKSGAEVVRKAATADLADALARLGACGADAELVSLAVGCLTADPASRPADAGGVAALVAAYRAGVEERLRTAERERAAAEAREGEQRKRFRLRLALAGAVSVVLLGGVAVAWREGDRKASEAKLEGQRDAEAAAKAEQARLGIADNLNLSADLRKGYRFKEADAALVTAVGLATNGSPDQLSALDQARRELAFVVLLDEIRYHKWIWVVEDKGKGNFNYRDVAQNYRETFATRGLDLSVLSVEEAVERVSSSRVKAEIVAAVDDWALYERDSSLQARLLDLARQCSPSDWANTLRERSLWKDRAALQKLADEIDVRECTLAAVTTLAELMVRQKLDPSRLLTTARTERPNEFELAMTLSQWLGINGKKQQAVSVLEAARALRPDNIAVLMNMASARRDEGDVDAALAINRRAVEIAPNSPVAHFSLGLSWRQKSDVGRALQAFRRATELNPNYVSAQREFAYHLRKSGELHGALSGYRKVLELVPHQADAHFDLGAVLADNGDQVGAIAAYRRAIELDPKYANAHTNLGNALRDKGDLSGALAAHRKAIEFDPENSNAHYNYGLSLAKRGDRKEAIAAYRRATELDPKNADAHNNLGNQLRREGELDEAVAAHRKAIEIDPKHPLAYSGLGLALVGKGDLTWAVAAHKKAVELAPMNPIVHHNLGNALRQKNELEAAAAAFRRATELDPQLAASHFSLGQTLGRLGDADRAIAAYQKAINCDPSFAEAHCNLGLQFARQNRFADALPHFRAGHELGSKRPGWKLTSAKWVADCEKELAAQQERTAPPPRPKP